MSEILDQVIERATVDAAFRAQLTSDPERALAGYALTPDERAALLSHGPHGPAAHRLDARVTQHHHREPTEPGEAWPTGPLG